LKLTTSIAINTLAAVLLTATLPAGAGGSELTAGSVDTTEADYLAYVREEEKLARDVYITLYQAWGLTVFDNIAASEETHTTTVEDMIEKYRLTDPVADDTVGVFVNPDLASLYTTLVTRGSQNSVEALYVGAAIEELDMIDLQAAIDATYNGDIRQLYENLMRGSRNHLRAYVTRIESLGIVYEAQYLTQEQVDEIVDSPVERGDGHH
jgi:hypothetical protein